MNKFLLHSHSLDQLPQKKAIINIINAALEAVDPYRCVCNHLHFDNHRLLIEDQVVNLNDFCGVSIIGFGKAVIPMALAVGDIFEEIPIHGCIITKSRDIADVDRLPKTVELLIGDHPIPGEDSLASSTRLSEFIAGMDPRELVICLVSGGGSALLSQPKPGITLRDLQELTKTLLESGAEINEINTLRKHLDVLKGGGLARLIYPRQMITLILSDVIGNPLDVIASGPTVHDNSTYLECLTILEKRGITTRIPGGILKLLQKGQQEEIQGIGNTDEAFDHVRNVIVGSNLQAGMRAVEVAKSKGFNSFLLTSSLKGEARDLGIVLAGIIQSIVEVEQPIPRPACIIAGGESTVTVSGNGKGGRNLEMALGAVASLAGLRDVALITLATDGEDGPTDAAGAVVTGETATRACALGMQPDEYLRRNNSYLFFDRLNDLIRTGSTGTNVNDLVFLFAF